MSAGKEEKWVCCAPRSDEIGLFSYRILKLPSSVVG